MTTIGPYEVVRELGRGGMGIVYEVLDPRAGRRLALKQLLAGAIEPDDLLRFRREAELLARVRHPGVVVVHELGTGPAGPFLVTDLVPGRSLRALAREGLAPREAARLVRELSDAVEALHAQGVLHRDLKGENVIVRPDGRPVILDFGVARDVDDRERLTQTGAVVGTPTHMAPEQALGASATTLGPPVDVHGLGAVLFEGLLGRPPFEGRTVVALLAAIQLDPPRWPSEERPGHVPWPLEAVLRRCLAKAPSARYPTAAALRDDLDRFLAGQAPDALVDFPGPARRLAGTLGVAIVLALVATAAVLAGRRRAPSGPGVASVPSRAPGPSARPSSSDPPGTRPARRRPVAPLELVARVRVAGPVAAAASDSRATRARFVDAHTLVAWSRASESNRLVRFVVDGSSVIPTASVDLIVDDLAVSPDLTALYALSEGTLLTLDATTLRATATRKAPGLRLVVLDDGRVAVAGEGTVVLDPRSAESAEVPLPSPPGRGPDHAHTRAFLAAGRALVRVRALKREEGIVGEGEVQVWDLSGLDAGAVGPPRSVRLRYPVNAAALASDGGLLALGFAGGVISLDAPAAGDLPSRWLDGQEAPVGADDTGLVLSAAAHQRRQSMATIQGLAFSPDGRRLVSLVSDEARPGTLNRAELALWDTGSGARLALVQTEDAPRLTVDLAASPDGALLAVGDTEGWVRVWRVDVAR